jgi:hypothetical protein
MLPTTKNGWFSTKKYLPLDFDLVYVKFENKILPAWFAFNKWDGIKLPKNPEIEYWRRFHG